MEKYVPYEKLSKKKKRERDAKKRGTWGSLSPVTRKPENSKAYHRKKAQNWKGKQFPNNSVPYFLTEVTVTLFLHNERSPDRYYR